MCHQCLGRWPCLKFCQVLTPQALVRLVSPRGQRNTDSVIVRGHHQLSFISSNKGNVVCWDKLNRSFLGCNWTCIPTGVLLDFEVIDGYRRKLVKLYFRRPTHHVFFVKHNALWKLTLMLSSQIVVHCCYIEIVHDAGKGNQLIRLTSILIEASSLPNCPWCW